MVIRTQLTLFISEGGETIEEIRKQFNPAQHSLIPAHVTLCREEEIASLDLIVENIKSIKTVTPIRIEFGPPERFNDGRGVLVPGRGDNTEFLEMRRRVLTGSSHLPEKQLPHMTLMHPRNSTCTDAIFNQIRKYALPGSITFTKISLIEQRNGGRWKIIEEFPLDDK